MERVAGGYALAEAPVAAPDGGLFFSDALGGGVYHWSPTTGAVAVVIPTRRGVGGMALHADGGLVVSGRDVSLVRDGETTVLYAEDGVTGFNDLTVDPEGRVVAGALRFNPFAGEPVVPGEFLRLDGGREATIVIAGVEWVNGCGFSPGGGTFYGCDYRRGLVLAADRRDDGTYGEPRTLVTSPGDADGMAVDENGALWVALGGRGTVGRFRPDDGTLEDELEVPGASFVASLCFAGDDGRDLFITTGGDPQDPDGGGGVFRMRSPVAGAPIEPVR